jgi:glutamine synthetase
MSRFILIRVCEEFGIVVTFDPKPIPGDWNGAGCHTNVSTDDTRKPGGYEAIKTYMERLGAPGKQAEHIEAYDPSGGIDNLRRLTGKHETASIKEFSWGVANRGASVRIPRMTEKDNAGYFEDRRPASNMDPYAVTGKIMETCVLPDADPNAKAAAGCLY